MKSLNSEDSFINLMIEETYQGLPEHDASRAPSDLFAYFQRHDRDTDHDHAPPALSLPDLPPETPVESFGEYCSKKKFDFYELSLEKKSSFFHMNLPESVLDFPANWSIFKTLKNSLEKNYDTMIQINLKNNPDSLWQILGPLCPYTSEMVFVVHANRCYLLYLPLGDIKTLHFIEKKLVTFQRAA